MNGAGGALAPDAGADTGAAADVAGAEGVDPFGGVLAVGEAAGGAAEFGGAGVDAGLEADVVGADVVCAKAAAVRKGAQTTAPASKRRSLINQNLHGRPRAPLDARRHPFIYQPKVTKFAQRRTCGDRVSTQMPR